MFSLGKYEIGIQRNVNYVGNARKWFFTNYSTKQISSMLLELLNNLLGSTYFKGRLISLRKHPEKVKQIGAMGKGALSRNHFLT